MQTGSQFMRSLFLSFAILLLFAWPGQPTHAAEHYLAAQLNHANMDSSRPDEGSGLGATFLYGRDMVDNWGLEVRLSSLVLKSPAEIRSDFYQQDLGVDAIYHFGDFNGWRPYALAGLSVIRNDAIPDSHDGTGLGIAIGGGITGAMSENLGLRWRFDLRLVQDEHDEGFQDIRLGAGVQIPLGRQAARREPPPSPGQQRDSDGDGVADAYDRCPFTLRGASINEFGCMYPNQRFRLPDVDFRTGTAILTPAAREELGKVVLALRGQPDLKIRIVGHTDSVGSAALNQELSLERAEAVATYLALQGVATQRLQTDGRGQTEPVADNATAEGRARNRRIEIHLLAPDDQ